MKKPQTQKRSIKAIICLILMSCLITAIVPVKAEAAVTVKAGTRTGNAKVLKWGSKKTYVTKMTGSRKEYWFKFKTCSDRRFYTIVLKNCNIGGSVYCEITDKYRERLDYDYVWNNYREDFNLKLKTSQFYYIHFVNNSGKGGNFKFRIESRKDKEGDSVRAAKTIKTGKTAVASIDGKGDVDYLKFKPASTGYYVIYIKNCSCSSSVRADIMDQYEDSYDYDYAWKGYEEKLTAKLKKNNWYYVKCAGDGVGTYKVTVKKD